MFKLILEHWKAWKHWKGIGTFGTKQIKVTVYHNAVRSKNYSHACAVSAVI